ncbi:hypothetical protein DFH08DRAFT_727020 [Mycena albidolilacea]|uniref:Uncharacterized protein n=1 Tax=Mycena albidolilacea TaxID=1033008 RepID=A0AAD7AV80_9AGAR|nr:hypothetical protein DFH08DRAFT_727020 [Mycena albidolilacea]
MVFRCRNPYYLRISEKNVLPLYVYLDEAHVNWMTDNVLQHVLADLQPKILPKLKAEAAALNSTTAAKKPTVDTHRGDSYQFCYFIRKTEQHSVLIKTRHFSAAPPRKNHDMPPPPPPAQGSKRKIRKNDAPQSNKRRKTKGKGKAHDGNVTDDAVSSGDEDAAEPEATADASSAPPRRSQRSKKIVAGGYDEASPDSDVEMEDRPQNDTDSVSIQVKDEVTDPQLTQTPAQHESGGATAPIDIDIDEEEKPKPVLNLKYQDFSIYGHCLCIVIEPYPPLRSPSRAASHAPTVAPLFTPRGQIAAPSSAASLRARTPLFLPDDDERGETPAPFIGQEFRPSVPPLEEQEDDDGEHSDNGGMMAFSQVMNNYNHLPAGAADDDDDLDGAVFFGDADEMRELN